MSEDSLVKRNDLLDKITEWLYVGGHHYQGDFHVQFPKSGGVIDLRELLLEFHENRLYQDYLRGVDVGD